jgi:hypothetical protein
MKEKIMNFVKNKFLNPLYFDRNPEEKFIFLGALNIMAMILTLTFFKQLFLFSFFCIYFSRKHLFSNFDNSILSLLLSIILEAIFPKVFFLFLFFYFCFGIKYSFSNSKINIKNPPVALFVFFEFLMLIIFIYFIIFKAKYSFILTLLSFLLFLFFWIINYIRLNLQKFTNKDFFISIFQFFVIVFFYIFITLSALKAGNANATISLIAINLFLITAINILKQNLSKILEIFCFIILFSNLPILAGGDFEYLLISYQNYFVIAIIIINSIGFIVIFLKNKNYLDRAKILLMLILTLSFFFAEETIICIFYYLSTLALISFIFLDKKLDPKIILFTYFILFAICSIVTFFGMLASGYFRSSEWASITYMFVLNLIILTIFIGIMENRIGKIKKMGK